MCLSSLETQLENFDAFNLLEMKGILTIIIVLSLLSFVFKQANDNSQVPNHLSFLSSDTSKIAMFHLDSINSRFIKNAKPTSLSNNELELVEQIIKDCIANYNPKQEKLFRGLQAKNPDSDLNIEHSIIELSRYERQYLPAININGDKIVWINCLCNTLKLDWREKIIIVKDGGNCFFRLKVNLNKEQYFDLSVNGSA